MSSSPNKESHETTPTAPNETIQLILGKGVEMVVPRDPILEKCEFFKTRLSDGWQESTERPRISAPEIRPKEMVILLTALTKNDELNLAEFSMSELIHFAQTADRMKLDKYYARAIDEIFTRSLSLDSIVDFYKFAKDFDYSGDPSRKLDSEMERIENFVVENGQTIMKSRLSVLKELPNTMAQTMVNKRAEELKKMTVSKLIASHRVAKRWKLESVADAISQALVDYDLKDVEDAIRLWKFIKRTKLEGMEEKLKQYLADNANLILRKKADVIPDMPFPMAVHLFSCERGVTLTETQVLKMAQFWYDEHPTKQQNFGPKGLKIFYSLLPANLLENIKKTPRKAINPHLNDAKWFNAEYEKAQKARDPSKVLKNYGPAATGEFAVSVDRVELLGDTVYTR